MSIIVGLIVIITGALINKEQVSNIDIYFYSGLVLDAVLLIVFVKIIKSIKFNILKIKDL